MVMPQKSFWQNKRVFVTGHTGFKGTWLCWMLERLGAKVYAYSLAPETQPSLFELTDLQKQVQSEIGDIRDGKKLKGAVKRAQPDIVLHLAAQALVRRSYRDPVDTLTANIIGTAEMLEAIREVDCIKSVVIVTTDKCYENREWSRPYVEDDTLGGYDPYSASKACAEIITSAWRKSFFESSRKVGIASARAGNVIGGGDWSDDRLIPDMMRAASVGKVVTLRNPQSTRPWQHVVEPLRGYLLLAEKLFTNSEEFASAWNFGPIPDEEWSVGRIAQKVQSLWQLNIEIQSEKNHLLHEAGLLRLDIRKSQERLHWSPRWNTEQSVTETISWYKQFYRQEKSALDLTLNQIERYLHE